jgi:hypothetical protein
VRNGPTHDWTFCFVLLKFFWNIIHFISIIKATFTSVKFCCENSNKGWTCLYSLGGFSALFTFLVMWHTSVVSLPPGNVILTHLACPQNDVIFCLPWESLTYLSNEEQIKELLSIVVAPPKGYNGTGTGYFVTSCISSNFVSLAKEPRQVHHKKLAGNNILKIAIKCTNIIVFITILA